MKLVEYALPMCIPAGLAALVACSGQLAPTSSAGSKTGAPDLGGTGSSGNTGSNTSAPNPRSSGDTDNTTSGNTGWVETALTDAAISDASWSTIDAGVGIEAAVDIDAGVQLQCPSIDSVVASSYELLSSQPSTVSATTSPAGATVVWSATSATCPGVTVGGFFGNDGGAMSSGNSLMFECGSCPGTTTITAQTWLEFVPPGQDASANACSGMPFTSKQTTIVCEGCADVCVSPTPKYCPAADGGVCGACANLETDVNNCGACGTVCASGQTCASGVCTE